MLILASLVGHPVANSTDGFVLRGVDQATGGDWAAHSPPLPPHVQRFSTAAIGFSGPAVIQNAGVLQLQSSRTVTT